MRCLLNCFDTGISKRCMTPYHAHSFWQLELIMSNRAILHSEVGKYSLTASSVVFIPPEMKHQFRYSEPRARYLSFKFKLMPAGNHRYRLWKAEDPLLNKLLQTLASIFPEKLIPFPLEKDICERLLEACMEIYHETNFGNSHIHALSERVILMVEQQRDRGCTVSEIAQRLGYSRGALSSLFSKDMGIPLKGYIDRKRFERIQELLFESPLNISEIAWQCGFEHMHAFTRFVKRISGYAPRDLRRKLRPRGDGAARCSRNLPKRSV